MDETLRDFVATFKKKSTITIEQWMKHFNHEIWRICPQCGTHNDLRKTDHCEECQTKLK